MTAPTVGSVPLVAFHNMKEEAFPFSIEFYRLSNHEVVHTIVVTGPGKVYIPPIANDFGEAVGVRMSFADGSEEVAE